MIYMEKNVIRKLSGSPSGRTLISLSFGFFFLTSLTFAQQKNSKKFQGAEKKIHSLDKEYRVLINRKKYGDALRIVDEIIEIRGINPELIIKKADLHSKLDQTKKSLRWYRKLLALEVEHPKALYEIALQEKNGHIKIQRLKKAVSSLDDPKYFDFENLRPFIHLELGKAYFAKWIKFFDGKIKKDPKIKPFRAINQAKVEKAMIDHFEKAQAGEIDQKAVYIYLARIFLYKGLLIQALENINGATQTQIAKCREKETKKSSVHISDCLSKDDIPMLELKADLHSRLKQDKEAIHVYKEILKLDNINKIANFRLAKYFTKNKDIDNAKIHWDLLYKEYKDIPGIHLALGDIYFSYKTLENFEKALRLYKEHVRRNPNDFKILKKLGLLLYKKSYIEAFPFLTKAYELKENDPEITLLFGDHALRRRKLNKAIFYYKKYRMIAPPDPKVKKKIARAYISLANRLFLKKKWYQSISRYEKASEFHPLSRRVLNNIFSAYQNLGLSAFNKKDWRGSIHFLKKQLSLKPKNERVKNKILAAYKNLGVEEFENKRWPEAMIYLNKWLGKHPEDIKISLRISITLRNQKKYSEEANILEEILEIDPRNIQALEELSFLYSSKIHQPRKLIEISKKIIKYYPNHPRKAHYKRLIEVMLKNP